jgi:hypothetical protein
MTVDTTTQEIKYGKNINPCATFLNIFALISLSRIANPTSKSNPRKINAILYNSVFLVRLHIFPVTNRYRKLLPPHQGLLKIPSEYLKSLNAKTIPAIGR